ncbi:LysE family translocator [Tateyamaria sp. ANG-S1]|uniref:LysE family translocator n=1 Tax=Tateyamaria sp. ANG-S1 TaxID=1577905 RepID=UPI00057CD5EB|nr:LysE family translocator [Tateyamaria sp. ANG-S1]KIC47826.1 lysine transporter LysE [Tateyamaria sp. ANG-S1]
MTTEIYLVYLAAVAVFFATPPDTSQLLIIANSMRHGLRRSLWVVAGDLSANVLQMTAAAFGLAAVIATSATAFSVIKWLGVAYLVWIGLRMMMSKGTSGRGQTAAGRPARLFRLGFVTSMTNPFAVVFFAALFPQFIVVDAAFLPQLLILGATYLVVDGATLLLWGWTGDRVAARLNASLATINRICGGLMIGAAALLGLKDITPQR